VLVILASTFHRSGRIRIVMGSGRITQTGSHEELMAQGGMYSHCPSHNSAGRGGWCGGMRFENLYRQV